MDKNYFNDSRPLPEVSLWDCCDCRNSFEIKFIESYPHAHQGINYCPVCGAKTEGVFASFKKIDKEIDA